MQKQHLVSPTIAAASEVNSDVAANAKANRAKCDSETKPCLIKHGNQLDYIETSISANYTYK